MPAGVADFGAGAWLAALFGVSAAITSYYVALCSDEPGIAADGTILADLEPVDSAYHRQSYGVGGGNWGLNGNYLATLVDVDFGTPLVDWGPITHYALVDASSGGNLYAWGEFLNPQYVTAGYQMVVPAGGIVLSLGSQDSSITV